MDCRTSTVYKNEHYFPSKTNHRQFDRKKRYNHRKKPPMCSFSISEPVTTDKTDVSCQSKSPTNHRQNFLSRLSVFLSVKPPILFFALWWFFGVAHRKTTDTFYGKFLLGGFLVSLTAKPPILFMGNFGSVVFWFPSPQNHRYYLVENLGLVFSLELSVLRFQALQKHFFISM